MEVRELTVRQWTPYKDELLIQLQDILGANKVIRHSHSNSISLRGGKMVVDFDMDTYETRVINRERGGINSGSITFKELKDVDAILFFWSRRVKRKIGGFKE